MTSGRRKSPHQTAAGFTSSYSSGIGLDRSNDGGLEVTGQVFEGVPHGWIHNVELCSGRQRWLCGTAVPLHSCIPRHHAVCEVRFTASSERCASADGSNVVFSGLVPRPLDFPQSRVRCENYSRSYQLAMEEF